MTPVHEAIFALHTHILSFFILFATLYDNLHKSNTKYKNFTQYGIADWRSIPGQGLVIKIHILNKNINIWFR